MVYGENNCSLWKKKLRRPIITFWMILKIWSSNVLNHCEFLDLAVILCGNAMSTCKLGELVEYLDYWKHPRVHISNMRFLIVTILSYLSPVSILICGSSVLFM
ncbi:unnamed protein product [Absidia cylindrospora]